ncbi:hypothetical protein K474DRAFT_1600449 [Panus rudis PR-1116 ss-1]|nr:hypothetical protein K474DRAFT_1600449 [Panus rudis PR-1116 ss-1]
MATIQERPFSKNYSGLINQSVIAVGIFVVCITSHELMRRKRRGKKWKNQEGLGSVESWEFGYLYQGRSWAKNPSPPLPLGWPLGWIKQVLTFPMDRFNALRGVDASLYVRFLKACFCFTLTHTLTTLPVLFPIHVEFSDGSVSPKSMTRASMSSLVATDKGQSLLWVHLLILIWITLTWIFTLYWICKGAFRFRAQKIQEAAERVAAAEEEKQTSQYHPHPHPQYPFHSPQPLEEDSSNRGIRLRTVMVTNIPPNLRSEKDLKEYFEYYMSRPLAKPSVGVTPTTQPGFLNRTFAFFFNRAKHIPGRLQRKITSNRLGEDGSESGHAALSDKTVTGDVPVIDRVVLVRKMTDLASLLERREECLRLLETAHIKLARKTLESVKEAMDARQNTNTGIVRNAVSRIPFPSKRPPASVDIEQGRPSDEGSAEGEDRTQLLIRTLGPYVQSLGSGGSYHKSHKVNLWKKQDLNVEMKSPISRASTIQEGLDSPPDKTVWEALLSLPRSTLDSYQPLIYLRALFRGKTVPSIDYYTAKLNLLTSLITEKRAKPVQEYTPMSTAFVTFANPADARRACKYLAVHPNNPFNACLVTMAPSYEDLDWNRLMKSTFRVEFVKDWVVNLGVWAFTIFWVFPVSIFVGLVSIQNISAFWPGLKHYLDRHEWEEELLQSFLPTILVALLALLIPLLLLLIAKKAHTIATLSALHDLIMTRYYKFLIVNVLVFFCVGTVALQSFLLSFKSTASLKLIQVVTDSFPTAAPFYVGWLIFTMAMHGGFELALFGLPLIMYPATRRQVTPRKRAVGIRPRTFNYYYWLPNHLLVIHVLLVFSILNPLVIPFGLLYFAVEATVIKNQLLHVYAKNYELNGQFILIRLIRYSLDGLILSQTVFLAYMVVLKKTVNVGVSAVLIILTALVKMVLTRICRARYERDNILEADIICRTGSGDPVSPSQSVDALSQEAEAMRPKGPRSWKDSISARTEFWTMKLATKINFAYTTLPRPRRDVRRQPNPFRSEGTSSPDNSCPVQESTSATGLLQKAATETIQGLPTLTHTQLQDSPEEIEPPSATPHPALVTPHPPHPRWDDNSSLDHPYENPYYTRPINDVLWLPRDPLGLLDLDDTVDMRMSLTSEPGAGKLGVWEDEEEFIGSSISSVLATSFGSIDEDLSYTPPVRHLDGSEIISLPSAIASRVEHIDDEDNVEDAPGVPHRRPSFMKRRTSSGASSHLPMRRPTTIDSSITGHNNHTSHGSQFRSFSLGEPTPSGRRQGAPSVTHRSFSERRRQNRAASIDIPRAIRPPNTPWHRTMSTKGASKSLLSVVERPPPPIIQDATTPGASSIISTREAVVGEVIVEEQEANQERLRQEQEEEERARAPRSWFTSWMFRRRLSATP